MGTQRDGRARQGSLCDDKDFNRIWPPLVRHGRQRRGTERSGKVRHSKARQGPQGKKNNMKALTFDTETTGINAQVDQIIELCVMPLGEDPITWRIYPSVQVSESAQAVHGISMDKLMGCPSFDQIEGEVREIFEEAEVLIGYNVGFDIAMLCAEFDRIKEPLDLSSKIIIDPFKLWQQKEPRSLSHAHQRFLGEQLEGAHAAENDVIGTIRILDAMCEEWGITGISWADLALICEPERANYVGMTHHFVWNEYGVASFGFGKHKGEPLHARKGYLQWMRGQSFPPDVHRVIDGLFDGTIKGRRDA